MSNVWNNQYAVTTRIAEQTRETELYKRGLGYGVVGHRVDGIGFHLGHVDGLTRIGQLQTMEETELMKRYGETGRRLFRLARGIDERPVNPR